MTTSLVFEYRTVLRSPSLDSLHFGSCYRSSVCYVGAPHHLERHLDNLLVHVLRAIGADGTVTRDDRDIANLLVETAADRTRPPIVRDKNDQHAIADIDATVHQLEQQLKKVLGVRD
jgi:hypothetical protein